MLVRFLFYNLDSMHFILAHDAVSSMTAKYFHYQQSENGMKSLGKFLIDKAEPNLVLDHREKFFKLKKKSLSKELNKKFFNLLIFCILNNYSPEQIIF